MTTASPLYCLDSNIFLAHLLPLPTRAPDLEVKAAGEIIKAIEKESLQVLISSIVMGEIRWVYLRENSPGYDIVEAAILNQPNIEILNINVPLAVQAAEFRKQYYSRANSFSYNDGLILATAVSQGSRCLITTDPHLLQIDELPTFTPSRFTNDFL